MKKILVLTLIALCAVVFGACSFGSFSEVDFDGVVSDYSYDTAKEAIENFLKEEFLNDGEWIYLDHEYESHEVIGELTSEEVGALPLSELEETVKNAQRVKITYNEICRDRWAHDDESKVYLKTERTHEIILLELESGKFLYFIPAAKIGESITRSELIKVYGGLLEKIVYLNGKNFTFNFESENNISYIAGGNSGTQSGKEKFTIKYDEDGLYFDGTVGSKNLRLYVSDKDKKAYIYEDNEWHSIDYLTPDNRGDYKYVGDDINIFEFIYNMQNGFSGLYLSDLCDMLEELPLQRTKSGYALGKEYLDAIIKDIEDEYEEEVVVDNFDVKINVDIKDKNIIRISSDIGGDVSNDEAKQVVKSNMTATVTDYGTTVVSMPDDLKEYISKQKSPVDPLYCE